MEWVETTGRTIEEAKEAALDELGVDEQDAEFEVLEEPKVGLFGRLRSEGRIRARVRPTTPRAKDDRGNRRRRSKTAGDGAAAAAETTGATPSVSARRAPASGGRVATGGRAAASGAATARPARPSRARATAVDGESVPAATSDASETDEDGAPIRLRTNPSRRRGSRGATRPAATGPDSTASTPSSDGASNAVVLSDAGAAGTDQSGTTDDDALRPVPTRSRSRKRAPAKTSAASRDDGIDAVEGTLMDVALDEQGKVAEQFLLGLLDSFALPAQVAVSVPDDDTIDIQVTGNDLGLLIGPKGATLLSIQDLTRTVVQRKTNAGNGRIFIDVSGYRQKRNEALTRFAHKVATDVLASQSRIAMEPMSAPDRKTVHDAITEIEGVDTTSEGEDAMRHVVVVPLSD